MLELKDRHKLKKSVKHIQNPQTKPNNKESRKGSSVMGEIMTESGFPDMFFYKGLKKGRKISLVFLERTFQK